MNLSNDINVAERKVIIDEAWEWEALECFFGKEMLGEIRYGGDDSPRQKFKFELKLSRVTNTEK